MASSTQSFTIRVLPALGDQLDLPLNNIRPYATFDMDFCLRNTDITWIGELDQVRTLGFDPVNRLAYVHERGEGIHVLRFNT